MKNERHLTPEELRERARRFFKRYGKDLEQIKSLLEIRLSQLALAYTIENKLPPEAVCTYTRVKSLDSFINKLERKDWPQFYFPTEIGGDLIGARIICWFIDDCYGFLNLLKSSKHLKITDPIEDYIKNPKPSGYRSVHLLANVAYDSVQRDVGGMEIKSEDMACEIQIRTKLQDAWGDVTHEFHYKAKNEGVDSPDLEGLLSDISSRLAVEDGTLVRFRDVYQRLADDKQKNETREGFRDE